MSVESIIGGPGEGGAFRTREGSTGQGAGLGRKMRSWSWIWVCCGSHDAGQCP